MRSTSRCADCWTCFTLLAPPHPASGGRDRARVVSLRRVLFSFFVSIFPKRLLVRIDTCQSGKLFCNNLSMWTDRLRSLWLGIWGSSPVHDVFFRDFFVLFQCKNMYDHRWWLSVVWAIEKSVLYPYYVLLALPLLLLCVLLLLLFLLHFVT